MVRAERSIHGNPRRLYLRLRLSADAEASDVEVTFRETLAEYSSQTSITVTISPSISQARFCEMARRDRVTLIDARIPELEFRHLRIRSRSDKWNSSSIILSVTRSRDRLLELIGKFNSFLRILKEKCHSMIEEG